MEIKNKRGEVLHTYEDSHDFSDLELREAVFAGLVLQGAHFSFTDLSGANCRGSDFYWGIFFSANLTRADLEGAQLQGADFKKADLTNANLKNANLGRDNLGGSSQLQGANFTGADLRGTNLTGAEYDRETVFPLGFHPDKFGLILKD